MVEMMRLGIKRVSDASKSTAISVKAGSITMTMGIVMLNIKFIIRLLNHYPQGGDRSQNGERLPLHLLHNCIFNVLRLICWYYSHLRLLQYMQHVS